MTIVFAPQARDDLEELHAYIARQSPARGALALARIHRAINRLKMFPHGGRQGAIQNTLELIVPGLPYKVIYQIWRDQVVIERVIHSSRRWPPGDEPDRP